jgi:acyl-CoA thioesterase-2
MTESVARLLSILDLKQVEAGCFEGGCANHGGAHLFGGQVLAQALVASQRCSRGHPANSCHAYFLKRGDPTRPIRFRVEQRRESRAFETYQVVASQDGTPILEMLASHHMPEPGPEHQIPMDEVGAPEGESYEETLLRLMAPQGHAMAELELELPVEIRTMGGIGLFSRDVRPPSARCWLRFRSRLPDDVALHQACFAYASDYAIMAPALDPHPVTTMDMQTASLDHAIWFHRPFRADEWMLFELDSPAAFGGRAVGRGLLYDAGGHLVASCTQEATLRHLTGPKFSGGVPSLQIE